MLAANGLTLWRGLYCLFEDLSIQLNPGDGLHISGVNGAGKTTLLRVLAGLTEPEAGEVTWMGMPIARQRNTYGRVMAWCGHRVGAHPDLTVAANLQFAARHAAVPDQAWEARLDAFGLTDRADVSLRLLSAGQQRRVALTQLLISGAELWLLDEPFTHLDGDARAYLEGCLTEHREQGGLVALTSHQAPASGMAFNRLELGRRQPVQ